MPAEPQPITKLTGLKLWRAMLRFTWMCLIRGNRRTHLERPTAYEAWLHHTGQLEEPSRKREIDRFRRETPEEYDEILRSSFHMRNAHV